ncbi:uncharacterized protein LOC124147510 isoform X1 [Haliotis rufescens]|uniref:uncharacterized protein LOC124147510 isoform X1 n=1 Tax=Haliotis rufescens TaxID=6454 RepID=UPI00201F5B8E|nr:uncharacterized protein LOC124147510 isoform X1 [Haliotis rufescens]
MIMATAYLLMTFLSVAHCSNHTTMTADSDTCEAKSEKCANMTEVVHIVFMNGDFRSIVSDEKLRLDCSEEYREDVQLCTKHVRSECGDKANHLRLFEFAYDYICNRKHDFIEAEECIHSKDFTNVLLHCVKEFNKGEAGMCSDYPACIKRRLSRSKDCSTEDARTIGGLLRGAMIRKHMHCQHLPD